MQRVVCRPTGVAVGLALLAVLLIAAGQQAAPSSAASKKTAKTVVPLPNENDITIAQVTIKAKSGRKLRSKPKLKLRGASSLPSGVTVTAAVTKKTNSKSRTAYFLIVRPKSSIDVAPASLGAQEEEEAKVSITGRVPLRVKRKYAKNIVSTDQSGSAACGGFLGSSGSYKDLSGDAMTDAVLDAAKRRCKKEPPFSVVSISDSWTHHKPTQDETLVCAFFATDPAQANAPNHAFLGRDTGLGFPIIASGPGQLNGNGMQTVSFAVQQAGTYRMSVWVHGASDISQSTSITIVVPPPELNGPSVCS